MKLFSRPLIRRRKQHAFCLETLEQRQLLASDLLISEFMAHNTSSIVDADQEHSDWIELFNNGVAAQDLGGWYLTNDTNALDKWQFPSNTIIEPGEFLLAFASGKDRRAVEHELHTNFELRNENGYLALVDETLTVRHDYVGYPTQFADVAYGIPMPSRRPTTAVVVQPVADTWLRESAPAR